MEIHLKEGVITFLKKIETEGSLWYEWRLKRDQDAMVNRCYILGWIEVDRAKITITPLGKFIIRYYELQDDIHRNRKKLDSARTDEMIRGGFKSICRCIKQQGACQNGKKDKKKSV